MSALLSAGADVGGGAAGSAAEAEAARSAAWLGAVLAAAGSIGCGADADGKNYLPTDAYVKARRPADAMK